MRSHRSSILFVLAVLGFVALSMTPRGLALCVGGGHQLGEALAGWCDEHASHVHVPHEHDHEVASASCEDQHQHKDHSEPCADIPLGLDDCRPQVTKCDLSSLHHVLAPPMAQPLATLAIVAPIKELRLRAWPDIMGDDHQPAAVRDALRAIILLI